MTAIQAAVAFVWLGMVLAISFLETPLKFRAPGMTVALGVAVGRLVFRALNLVEAAFAAVLVVAVLVPWPPQSWLRVGLVAGLIVVLAAGAAWLRPLMDARVRRGETATSQPRHLLHIGYVGLECFKVLLLLVLGISALAGALGISALAG